MKRSDKCKSKREQTTQNDYSKIKDEILKEFLVNNKPDTIFDLEERPTEFRFKIKYLQSATYFLEYDMQIHSIVMENKNEPSLIGLWKVLRDKKYRTRAIIVQNKTTYHDISMYVSDFN